MDKTLPSVAFVDSVLSKITWLDWRTCNWRETLNTNSENKTVQLLLELVAYQIAGPDAANAVLLNCMHGTNRLGELFLLISTYEAESRYLGMRDAFGEDNETCQPRAKGRYRREPSELSLFDRAAILERSATRHSEVSSRPASPYWKVTSDDPWAPLLWAVKETAAFQMKRPLRLLWLATCVLPVPVVWFFFCKSRFEWVWLGILATYIGLKVRST